MKEKITVNAYRKRLFPLMKSMISECKGLSNALDFGSGDGYFAFEIGRQGIVNEIIPLDVLKRKNCFLEPVIYRGGEPVPYEERCFDLVYAIDVIHHCDNPLAIIKELTRCSRKYLLIKDHTYHNYFEKTVLSVLDEIGNRRFGVRSLCNYQYDHEWFKLISDSGFKLEKLIQPVKCHVGPLGWFTNHLQFIALWSRI
jgi:SAM-dependent methyltransferase